MAGLGALVIVAGNPNGVLSASQAVTRIVGGTMQTILSSRKA